LCGFDIFAKNAFLFCLQRLEPFTHRLIAALRLEKDNFQADVIIV
jgi:hypothetical protein